MPFIPFTFRIGNRHQAAETDRNAEKGLTTLAGSSFFHPGPHEGEAVLRCSERDYAITITLIRGARVRTDVNRKLIWDDEVPSGLTYLVRPNDALRAITTGPFRCCYISIPEDFLTGIFEEHDIPFPCSRVETFGRVNFVQDPLLCKLCLYLIDADQLADTYDSIFAEGVSLAFLARFAERFGKKQAQWLGFSGGLPSWRLKRVEDYIQAKLNGPITLAEMADSVGLSRMHFAAQFRRTTGLTPTQFLTQARLRRAQEVLRESRASIAQVCSDSGFRSQAHFARVFKEHLGVTPSKWAASFRTARMSSNNGHTEPLSNFENGSER